MSKEKISLALLAILLIITTTILSKSNIDNKYDYEVNIENALPMAGSNLSAFIISGNMEEVVFDIEKFAPIRGREFDFTVEDISREEENKLVEDKKIEEIIEDEDNHNQETEIIVDNGTDQPNKETPTNDNRTVNPNLSQHLNNYVLDLIKTYNYQGGNYPYLLNNDYENYNGVTEDIHYKGEVLLKAHPSGIKYSHCTGISFEVFFKAMQNRNRAYGIDINDFNGMTNEDMHDFMLTWYVAKGPKSQSNLLVAIEKYGLGNRITNLEEAAPGDFIDLSRENNTGHAVIFLDWIRQGDRIIGLKFWSSQQSTGGISHREEYFNIKDSNGKKYGNVILDSLYIARINPISEYR